MNGRWADREKGNLRFFGDHPNRGLMQSSPKRIGLYVVAFEIWSEDRSDR